MLQCASPRSETDFTAAGWIRPEVHAPRSVQPVYTVVLLSSPHWANRSSDVQTRSDRRANSLLGRSINRRVFLTATLAGAGSLLLRGSAPAAAQGKGPSSSSAPYVLALPPGGDTGANLAAGDAGDNGYRMVGVTDGVGAFQAGDEMVLLM